MHRRLLRLLPALLLVAIPAGVAARGAELGLWSAALSLSSDGSIEEVLERGDRVADFLSALSKGIQVDPATEAWLNDLRDCVVELDLHRTWERLPDVRGSEHRVHVTGRQAAAEGYALTLGDRPAPPRHQLGDLDGHAALTPQPWQGSTAFRASGSLQLASHPVGPQELRQMAGALLVALTTATEGTGGAETGRALEARVRTDFPHTMDVLDRVLTFDGWGRRLDDGVLQVELSARVDPRRLAEAGYPSLARFVRRMSDVADLSLSLRSRHGALGTVWARSPGHYGVRFATRDGALVPVTPDGMPQLPGALPVATLPAADLALRPHGIIRLKGVRLSVHSWTVPLRYRVGNNTASLTADIRTLPDVDFRSDGGVGGWLVATAGNAVGLEDQALRFFQSVADGPEGAEGRGSRISVSAHPQRNRWTIDGAWDVRMLDNLVVRFAAQVMGDRIVPDDAVLDELLSLESSLVGALAADWQQARPRVASRTP